MIWQKINRSSADKVFVVAQNVSGGTLVANSCAVYDVSASADGVRATTPVTSTLSSVIGIWATAVVDSAFAAVQAYGFRATTSCINHTSTPVVAGDIMIPVTGVGYLARSAAADGKSGFFTAGFAIATGSATGVNAPIFIKCL
jgi:hypothetical protein